MYGCRTERFIPQPSSRINVVEINVVEINVVEINIVEINDGDCQLG